MTERQRVIKVTGETAEPGTQLHESRHSATRTFHSQSRLDEILPFIKALPLQALERICLSAQLYYPAHRLQSAEVGNLVENVSLDALAKVLSEVALEYVPAQAILFCPLRILVSTVDLMVERGVLVNPIPTDILHVVKYYGVTDWETLGGFYLNDILESKAGTISLVKELFSSVICFGMAEILDHNQFDISLRAQTRTPRAPSESELALALSAVSTWAEAVRPGGTVLDAVATAGQSTGAPEEVRSAHQVVASALAVSIVTDRLAKYDPRAAIQRALSSLDARHLRILAARTLALRNRQSLVELGECLDVTRERVRQLETVAERHLNSALWQSNNRVISGAANEYASRFGAVAPVSALIQTCPNILTFNDAQPSLDVIVALVLLRIGGPFEVSNEWLIRGSYQDMIRRSIAVLDHATEAGPIALQAALDALGSIGVLGPYRAQWLAVVPGFRIRDGRLERWRGTLVDKAEIILRSAGVPLTKEQIAKALEHNNPRAIGERLRSDNQNRFSRCGFKSYALREWGLEEYSTIEDQIEKEIERQGGEAAIESISTDLSLRFGVSENSVRAYAVGRNFVGTRPGWIRLRTDSDIPPAAPPIETAKGCYRLLQGWGTRLTVTEDMLRGSGTPIHEAFVGHVGITWPGAKRVPSAYGDVHIASGSIQGSIGSLREVVNELGAHQGDFLFVEFAGGTEFKFHLVRTQELEAASPGEKLALNVGLRLENWNGDVLGGMMHALGLTESRRSVGQIRRRLIERHEPDLLPLLEMACPDQQIGQASGRSLLERLEYILRG